MGKRKQKNIPFHTGIEIVKACQHKRQDDEKNTQIYLISGTVLIITTVLIWFLVLDDAVTEWQIYFVLALLFLPTVILFFKAWQKSPDYDCTVDIDKETKIEL